MDNELHNKPDLSFQELVVCVEKALLEAGKLARKRAEQKGTPLVVSNEINDEWNKCYLEPQEKHVQEAL